MTLAEEILALQIAEDPDFLKKREVLYQAMLDAQSKVKICPEPEYSQLVEAFAKAQNAFRNQGVKWVAHVHCGHALKSASLGLANQQAADNLKSERHAEVNKGAMRRARDKNG